MGITRVFFSNQSFCDHLKRRKRNKDQMLLIFYLFSLSWSNVPFNAASGLSKKRRTIPTSGDDVWWTKVESMRQSHPLNRGKKKWKRSIWNVEWNNQLPIARCTAISFLLLHIVKLLWIRLQVTLIHWPDMRHMRGFLDDWTKCRGGTRRLLHTCVQYTRNYRYSLRICTVNLPKGDIIAPLMHNLARLQFHRVSTTCSIVRS